MSWGDYPEWYCDGLLAPPTDAEKIKAFPSDAAVEAVTRLLAKQIASGLEIEVTTAEVRISARSFLLAAAQVDFESDE